MSNDTEKSRETGGEKIGEGQPLCPGCLEPVNPIDYYCPKCGAATGQLTPYIPFVNIRFNYSIYGRLWQKVWYEKTGLLMKIFSLGLIVLFVPFMLVGLPFVVWDKLKKTNTDVEAKNLFPKGRA